MSVQTPSKPQSGLPRPARPIYIYTYDFEEFLKLVRPAAEDTPIRYDLRVRERPLGVIRVVLRLYGVDRAGRIVVFAKRFTTTVARQEEAKAWIRKWEEIFEKLGAKPGKYLYG